MTRTVLTPPSKPFGHNDALTGLRGFAALLVVFSHLANAGLFFDVFAGGGKLGVWIFFILSAYLMTRLYFWRDPGDTMVSYSAARIGRVLPLYFLLVIISLFFVGEEFWRYQFTDTSITALALLLIRAPQELWAVPTEVQFYLCFAVLWLLAHKGIIDSYKRLAIAFAAILALSVAVTVALKLSGQTLIGLNLYMHLFLLGMLAAIFEDQFDRIVEFARSKMGSFLLALTGAILLASCLPGLRLYAGIRIPSNLDLPAAVCTFVLFNLVLRHIGFLKALATRPLVFLGDISYGFYLIHHLVITFAITQLSGLHWAVTSAGVIIVSMILATISFYAFEKPMAKLVRRGIGTRKVARRAW